MRCVFGFLGMRVDAILHTLRLTTRQCCLESQARAGGCRFPKRLFVMAYRYGRDNELPNEASVTIYELTQAMRRYRRLIFIGLGVLVAFVLVISFTFEDGGIAWRGGQKWEAGFQISVVTPGEESLSQPEDSGNLSGTAAVYADLLTTGEAAEAVGEMSGYKLGEAINAGTPRASSVISGTVIGPSEELAIVASQNSFVWLSQKIQQPLDALPAVATTTTVPPSVSLEGPFVSTLSVEVDASLAEVPPDLFVLIDAGQNQPVAIPVAERANNTVEAGAVLEAGGSLQMRIETSDGTPLDSLRLAPGPLPTSAAAYPTLTLTLGPGALHEVEVEVPPPADGSGGEEPITQLVWVFDSAAISTKWLEGTPEPAVPDAEGTQLQIAMLTEVPTAQQIGGRKGPLIGFAVFVIGLIMILTSVIIIDSWRRDRDSREVSAVRIDPLASGGAASSGAAVGSGESGVSEISLHET